MKPLYPPRGKGTHGCVSVWVSVCNRETDGGRQKQFSEEVRLQRGCEAENSTIHLAVVIVVVRYPTRAENTQGLNMRVCVHIQRK